MRVIYHINAILNDLYKFLLQVYENSYTACTELHADQYSNSLNSKLVLA